MSRKLFLWFFFGGLIYLPMEGIWRIPSNGGWANIAMFAVGGFALVFIGGLNQSPKFYNLPMLLQALVGSFLVLFIELVAGVFLNIGLELQIWDYSHIPLNLYGQICLSMWFVWLLLMPFAIWLEDRLNYVWHRYENGAKVWDYGLIEAYKELVKWA